MRFNFPVFSVFGTWILPPISVTGIRNVRLPAKVHHSSLECVRSSKMLIMLKNAYFTICPLKMFENGLEAYFRLYCGILRLRVHLLGAESIVELRLRENRHIRAASSMCAPPIGCTDHDVCTSPFDMHVCFEALTIRVRKRANRCSCVRSRSAWLRRICVSDPLFWFSRIGPADRKFGKEFP